MAKALAGRDRLTAYESVGDLLRRILEGGVPWKFAKPRLGALAEGRDYAPDDKGHPTRIHDRAAEEQARQQAFWWTIGCVDVRVPKPAVSNRQYDAWQRSASGLIYVPVNTREFYERFMRRMGQGGHWTVTHQDRERIVWDEPERAGYWIALDVSQNCPRMGTPWNTLNEQIHLLSLVEYAIAWYVFRTKSGTLLDLRTWCWLRTQYRYDDGRLGALYAYELDGEVSVDRYGPGSLAVPRSDFGGRAAEAVANAA